MSNMDDVESQESELMDEVGSLKFSPPPMKKSDTRDSISSVDSDVSLSFDRRGSKGEEADADLSDSGSSDLETTETARLASINLITSQSNLHTRHKPKNLGTIVAPEVPNEAKPSIDESGKKVRDDDEKNGETTGDGNDENRGTSKMENSRKTTDEEDEDEVPTCTDELAEKISDQVEFYFSDENIVKDAFLLKHVKRNKEGYVSLKLISSFKRVKHLNRDWRIVGAALRAKSTKLEVNEQGTKLRRRDPLPPYDQTVPSRTVLAARLPVEKLSIESVAELFGNCGEIVLIRVLRPGNPAPAEVRQAIAKRPELANSEECALIEFTDSAAARAALALPLGEARIYELQQSSSTEKKRKPQNQQNQQNHQQQPYQQQPAMATKKSVQGRIARENAYNSSSCASGSDAEDSRILRNARQTRVHPVCHHVGFPPPPGHGFQGPPSPEAWLTRRLSSCSITGVDNTGNGIILRRLSSCSGSGSSSDTGSYSSRRFSTCSSGSETGYPPAPIWGHHLPHNPTNHPNVSQIHPNVGYYNQGRRFSCCSATGSVPGSPTTNGYGYGYDYTNSNGFYGQTGRRGSADCGPFLRRLSSCSRDSGFFDPSNRRTSSCSSSSDSGNVQFRPRSNSGFVLMAHLPENVTRMPAGPDGTRGFGRNSSNVTTEHHKTTQSATAIESKCR